MSLTHNIGSLNAALVRHAVAENEHFCRSSASRRALGGRGIQLPMFQKDRTQSLNDAMTENGTML